ncbi:hypothetical protein [uncultured Microbacterium sp.]|uniref:hypothetical protein n=1 Tax=uncultured Microbacterium sp. TaxID=191216 RepID=UPI00260F1286|nr:hypothetical protein [uncultured Microbacterium sp.]
MSEINYAALDAADRAEKPKDFSPRVRAAVQDVADRAEKPKASPRVRAAVKSTAERVKEAAAELAKLEAQLADERELAVLRAAYAVQHGVEAKKSMKRTALIDALAEKFGIA